jgi:CRP/FNR family transcriptional regulator, cyclic AMP receptor protein
VDRGRIAAHAFMTGIPEEELDAVALAASERDFAAGEALMSEGDFGHSLFLVEDGSAEVSVDGIAVGTVGPGEVIGEVAVLASGRRTASVVATTPIRAISFFKRDVWGLERTAPETARRLRAAIKEHAGSA